MQNYCEQVGMYLMRNTLNAGSHVIFLTSVHVVVVVVSLLSAKHFITKRIIASAQLISLIVLYLDS